MANSLDWLDDIQTSVSVFGDKMVFCRVSAVMPGDTEGAPGPEIISEWLKAFGYTDLPNAEKNGILVYNYTAKNIYTGKHAGKKYARVIMRYIPKKD